MKTNFHAPQQPPSTQATSHAQQTAQTQTTNQPTETPRHHHHQGAFQGGGMHRGMMFKHGLKRHQPPSRGRNGPKARTRRAGARAMQMGHEDDEHHGLHPDELKEMADEAWAHIGTESDTAQHGDTRGAMSQQQQQRPKNETELPPPTCKPVSGFRAKPPTNESLSKKSWPGADLLFSPKGNKQIPQRDLDLALAHVYFGVMLEKLATTMQAMATSLRTMALHSAMAAYLDKSEPRHAPPTVAEAKAIAMEASPRNAARKPGTEQQQNAFLGAIPFMLEAMRRRTPKELGIAKAGLLNGKSASQLRMPKTPTPTDNKRS